MMMVVNDIGRIDYGALVTFFGVLMTFVLSVWLVVGW